MRLIHGTARHPSGWELGILQGEEPQVGLERWISWAGDGRLASQPSPEAVGAVSGFGGELPSIRHSPVFGKCLVFKIPLLAHLASLNLCPSPACSAN